MTNNEKIIELIGIFEKGKNKFLKEEKEIIEIDVNERTLSARLMFHLQTLLLENESYKETYKPYSVDCEYNRMNKDMKKIIQEDNIVNLIYPDIILHKRKLIIRFHLLFLFLFRCFCNLFQEAFQLAHIFKATINTSKTNISNFI